MEPSDATGTGNQTPPQIPPKPRDPIGGWLWDMTYGIGAKVNPLLKAAGKLEDVNSIKEGVSENVMMFAEVLQILRELNDNLKILNETLKLITPIEKEKEADHGTVRRDH